MNKDNNLMISQLKSFSQKLAVDATTSQTNSSTPRATSDIDKFLSEYTIPPPPPSRVSYGMGVNFVYTPLSNRTSYFGDNLPPPPAFQMRQGVISGKSSAELGPKSSLAVSIGDLTIDMSSLPPPPPKLSKATVIGSTSTASSHPIQESIINSNDANNPDKKPFIKQAKTSDKAETKKQLKETIKITFSGQQSVDIHTQPDMTVEDAKKQALEKREIKNSDPQHWALQKPGAVLVYLDLQKLQDLEFIDELLIRHTQPDDFSVNITLESGEMVPVSVNLFSTAFECIKQLKSKLESEIDEDWDIAVLWLLPLDGGQPRFLKMDETPFSPLVTQTRFMLKFRNATDEEEDETHLVRINLYDDFSRNIVVKASSSASEVLAKFIKSINLSLEPTLESNLKLGRKQGTALIAIDPKQVIESNSTVQLLYKNLHATLDHMDALMEGHQPHKTLEAERESMQFPSLEDLKSLITSLAWNSEDRVIDTPPNRSSMQFVQNTAKVVEMLGVSTEMEVSDVKTRLHEIYGKELSKLAPVMEPDSEESSTKEQEAQSGRKRMVKLTNLLGIDNENELALFLLESSKKMANSKKTNAGEDKNSQEQRDKSVQKVAKILGVNDVNQQQQFRARKMAQYAPIASRKDLKKSTLKKSEEDSIKHGGKPTIVNGQFVVRVYLINQTFKSIQVPADMTATKLVSMLIERLNIKDGSDEYQLYIDKRTEEVEIDPSSKIFDVVNNMNHPREILVFRKKSFNKHASMESIQSFDSKKSTPNSLDSRRAAKVANIFGLSDRKNKISEEDNPDIKAVMKMLNTLNKEEQKRVSKDFTIEQIIKEGWLLKEEGDISIGQSRTKNCWCYIENGLLYAKMRQGTGGNNLGPPIVFKIADNKFQKSASRKNAFEIISKSNPSNVHLFYADSSKSSDDWLEALRGERPTNASTRTNTDSVASQATTDSSKVTMNDFEIKKVLGRGKFGKVLLCIQKSTRKVYAIKVIKKSSIKEERQIANSQNENRILRSIRHPFIVSLHYAFQTPERLHLVMEYVNGGELFFHINHFGRFSEERVRFYSAEIFLALQCLHGKGIVYRDLKLENILLDKDGHVKITDFGLSKHEDELDDDESVIAGTSEYLAPEVLGGIPHSYPADWWAYAVVVFEMVCGYHPFYVEDRDELFHRIMYLRVDYPDFVSETVADFLTRLFCRDPEKRLGSGPTGTLEIQSHPFFESINFDLLFQKAIEPPFKPDVVDDFDVSFFDDEFTGMPAVLTPTSSTLSRISKEDLFTDFSYNADSVLKK